MTKKVLITGTSIRPELLQPLRDAGLTIDNPSHTLSEAELAEKLSDAVAYLKGGSETATAPALEAAAHLKVIGFFGMGYESSVDVAAAKARGVAITITHDTLNNAVADLTLGLILSSVRKIHLNASQFERGETGSGEKQRDLEALQFGIVGLGGCGQRIAEVLRQGFRARVNYYSRTRKPDVEAHFGIGYRELDTLVAESDVLVVIVAGSPQTWGLIDRTRIERAKPGQIIVNTARPAIVEAEALLWGLTRGPLSYAAFDGFYKEPEAVVRALKEIAPYKLMVTTHIGSLTHEARDAMARKAVGSILNMLERGEDPDRVI